MSNNVQVVLSCNKANFSQAMAQAQSELDRFSGKARNAGHSTVSSMQASSAAIRLVEGGMTNNVRAVERFIATIPGVGKALQFAFPLVGALAFAGLIARMGQEVYQFIVKMNQVPLAIQNGFGSLNQSAQTALDELTKTNDELENQIAILQGKPANMLAVTLDDARIAADKLAESLQHDQERVTQLLKTQQIGWLGELLTGKDSTTAMSGAVDYWSQELRNRGDAYTLAVHQFGPNSTQAQTAKAAIEQRRKDAEAAMQMEIDVREPGPNRAPNVTGDQTANLNIARGYLSDLYTQEDMESQQARNAKDEATEKKLQAAKEYAAKVKAAQDQLVQTWKDGLDRLKAQRDMSAGEEANYWLTLANTVKTGSVAYKAAIEEANKDIAQEQKELAQERDKWQAAGMSPGSSFVGSDGKVQTGTLVTPDLSKNSDETRGIEDQSKATIEFLKNLNAGVSIQQANANAIAEASLKMAVAQGTISKLDAAEVQAQIHAQEYTQQLEKLRDALAAVQGSATLSPEEKSAQTTALKNQIDQLTGARIVQVAEDNSAIDMNTVGGSIRDALNLYVQEATDVGQQVASILTNAFTSVNSALSTSFLAHAYNGQEYRRNILNSLSGAARGVGSQALDSVFKNVEGNVLKGFGFGVKADGSQSSPYWVRIATGGASGVASGVGGSIASAFGKVGGGIGKFFSSIFQGFFADGGDVLANRPAIVGEAGPELFVPHSAGSIVPNDALGGTNHYWSVDARGSNDPAATEAAVNRAMRKALPMAVQASVHATREQMKRRPASRR